MAKKLKASRLVETVDPAQSDRDNRTLEEMVTKQCQERILEAHKTLANLAAMPEAVRKSTVADFRAAGVWI